MSNIKFYIILNIINIVLISYVFSYEWLCAKMLSGIYSNKIELLAVAIYLLCLASKFIFLPLLFGIMNFLFKNTFISSFIENLRTNANLRKKALINAFAYDAAIILFYIVGTIKDLLIDVLALPFFYEMTTAGGFLMFYVLLFRYWKCL